MKKDTSSSISPIFLIIIAFIYALFLFIYVRPMLQAHSKELVLPEDTVYYDSIEVNTIFLKNEILFGSEQVTEHKLAYDEGSRLPFGVIRAGKTPSKDYQELQRDLSKTLDRISILQQEISDIEVLLRESILQKKYMDVESLVKNFDYLYVDHSGEDSIAALKNKEKTIREQLFRMNESIGWNPPGLISYVTDGFEAYSTSAFQDMSSLEFDSLWEKESSHSIQGYFKIVDNFYGVFVFKVSDVKQFEPYMNQIVNIRLEGKDKFYKGRLSWNNNGEDGKVAGIHVNSYIEDLYPIRKATMEIIFREQPALKIPTTSIIQYNGISGVCVKDINGIVQFRPVEILKSDKDVSYVAKGNSSHMIENGETKTRTLAFYEEILKFPQLDKIGKIYRR
ncbi:MAG: HlyD family efflux transporter periplasmic adaptor subunit [Tissierellia bacterium]|nr:HlyD family efflux transporter periplasmic adaptor subunit [Tissierellia bacterium]